MGRRPLNLWQQLEYLDAETSVRLHKEIKRYLESQGIAVADESGFARGWQSGVQQVGGLFDTATGKMSPLKLETAIQKAIQLTPGDIGLILLPAVVSLEAPIRGERVKWDGVKRPIPGNRMVDQYNGTMPALSLRVIGMDMKGQRMYDTRAGLLVHFELVKKSDGFKLRFRKKAFQRWGHMEEGVELALGPLFGK